MPDRPLQIAAYAAGASLAAATLVYVFGPTFFLDTAAGEQNGGAARSTRRRGVVGLSNPANDCFINSVLQCLAGLPELRGFLAREVHLRRLGERGIWEVVEASEEEKEEHSEDERENGKSLQRGKELEGQEEVDHVVVPFVDRERTRRNGGKTVAPEWKVRGLQQGLITFALKDMLDGLNERPIYKKTLSAQAFVTQLETAFRSRINRSQQDAQEMLQLVTERLCDEYHAGRRARRRAIRRAQNGRLPDDHADSRVSLQHDAGDLLVPTTKAGETKLADGSERNRIPAEKGVPNEEQTSFPFEGKVESTIVCTHCKFEPKPTSSSFVTLTLHVPQGGNNTTLSACFDNILKVEHIDDFICARCQIQHALDTKLAGISKAAASAQAKLEKEAELLRKCLDTDPEDPPKGISLPDSSQAPRRRIARHSSIAAYPQVLAIHLSRSMWDEYASGTKNMVKVNFPERLPLGGLLERVRYRLLGVVTHKGGHNSGHYESFRRQVLKDPFMVPSTGFGGKGGLFEKLPQDDEERDAAVLAAATTPCDGPGTDINIPESAPIESAQDGDRFTSRTSLSIVHEATPKSNPRIEPSLVNKATTGVAEAKTDRSSLDNPTLSPSTPTSPSPAPSPGPNASPSRKSDIDKARRPRELRSKASLSRLAAGLVRLGSGNGSTNGPVSDPSPRGGQSMEGGSADLTSGNREREKEEREREKKLAQERKRKKEALARWWRISDDKIKECSTKDVLRMEREVYLLFYERLDGGDGEDD